MKRYFVPFLLFASSTPVFAQEGPRSIDLPNGMDIHTWFIIGSTGAFFAWSISYALQLHREAVERQKGRGDLLEQKNDLLNRIAELETRKESAGITDQRYKHEMRELRFRLMKVLEKIAHPGAQQPH